MRAILPGRPQSKRQAISTARWDDLRVVAYISGNAVILATGPNDLLQTIYLDTETSLHAIAIEESSGQVAVCGDKNVYIYKPIGRDESVLSWIQAHHLPLDEDEVVTSISWGSPEELMIGGSTLLLWYVEDDQRIIWRQEIPYPTAMAYFSHDGGILASCGQHDRTVKIWRRQSYEIESTRFDVSYLPHPISVTNLHWRKPWHSEMTLDNLLYTFCADNRIRVWSYSDPHSVSVMQMVAEIDMTATIQPRRLSVGSMSRRRYAFIIDSRDFSGATERAVQNATTGETDHALEHLIEVANRSPEICVVLDGLGHMSVWGLENAGSRSKQSTEVFNIAHVDDMNISIIQAAPKMQDYTQFCIFASNDSSLSLLVHSFDGLISWYEAHITHLFDTAPRKERVRQIASWGGHQHPVTGMARNQNGDLLCSWTDKELLVWKLTKSKSLKRIYSAKCTQVRDALFLEDELRVLDNGKLLRYGDLLDEKIGTKDQTSVSIGDVSNSPKLLLRCNGTSGVVKENGSITIPRTGQILEPPTNDRLWASSSDGWLAAVTVSEEGGLLGFHFSHRDLQRIPFTVSTNVKSPGLLTSTASGIVALTNNARNKLTIWDLKQGTFEKAMTFREPIEHIYWHQTRRSNVLAICFAFHIVLLGQSRFSRVAEDEAWVRLRDIRIRDFTSHPIGAVSCLDDGSLVVGAGNQLFVLEPKISRTYTSAGSAPSGLDLANSVLPIYHPEMINTLLAMGEHELVDKIFETLHEQLKYFSEGDILPSNLSTHLEAKVADDDSVSHPLPNGVNRDQSHLILSEIADRLRETIERHPLSHLSSSAQTSLVNSLGTALRLSAHRSSLDANALRYLYFLYSSTPDVDLPYSAICFASLSTSQEPVLALTTAFYGSKFTWAAARHSGLFLWLAGIEVLRTQMENVGRAEYTKHEDRNPVDCSLYYLALGKKTVLRGLWRQSIGIREKENTMKILANNFEEARWKATAMKNAYALLSKRRFEYGAAWFLLGGSLKDAVNVCAAEGQVGDLQLAVAVARVSESPNANSVLRDLIRATVLKEAVNSEQGRWMAAWAYHMLEQTEKGIQVLVRPVQEAIGVQISDFDGIPESLSWQVNDPLLAELYVQLREQLTHKGAWHGVLKPGEERDFVLRCASFHVRMGADLLALRLVRNWHFIEDSQARTTLPLTRDSLFNDRSANVETAAYETEVEAQEKKKKPPPTQFIEPSADSLLDSFGF